MMNLHPLAFLILATTLPLACSSNLEDEIDGSGTVEGTNTRVGSEVSGKVNRIWVDEGSSVKNGDTLMTIDATEYQAQLQQSLANAEAAEATYRLALEGSRKEDILQAEATYRAAESDYNRSKDLFASKTITRKQ
jgi:multidrug resistance efflux pump